MTRGIFFLCGNDDFCHVTFIVTEHDRERRKDTDTHQYHMATLTSHVNATWQRLHGKSMTHGILTLCGSGDVCHAFYVT